MPRTAGMFRQAGGRDTRRDLIGVFAIRNSERTGGIWLIFRPYSAPRGRFERSAGSYVEGLPSRVFGAKRSVCLVVVRIGNVEDPDATATANATAAAGVGFGGGMNRRAAGDEPHPVRRLARHCMDAAPRDRTQGVTDACAAGQSGNFSARSIAWKRGSLRSGSSRGSVFSKSSPESCKRMAVSSHSSALGRLPHCA